MKIYLVGGAVRNRLLNLPAADRDFVVVGASVEDMIALGYKPVGKDFPVFLHPETGEEYALARSEKKSGRGYGGFTFHTDKEVSLEADLLRRDLTINAMAMDENGNIIDPYSGQQDIQQRLLRHVSPAFVEDPLRILRIARFNARFADLGFHIADETLLLLCQMVRQGELIDLTPERIWQEVSTAMMTTQPAIFLRVLREVGALSVLFPRLDALYGVPARPDIHPEIDTGIHIEMSLTAAAALNASLPVRIATLLHDLGKGTTSPTEWPQHPQHNERGASLITEFANQYPLTRESLELAKIVSQFHTVCHRINQLSAEKVIELFIKVDAFRRPERFQAFLLACEADFKGRRGFENAPYLESEKAKRLFQAANQIDITQLVQAGYRDKTLGDEIIKARTNAIRHLI